MDKNVTNGTFDWSLSSLLELSRSAVYIRLVEIEHYKDTLGPISFKAPRSASERSEALLPSSWDIWQNPDHVASPTAVGAAEGSAEADLLLTPISKGFRCIAAYRGGVR